MRESHFLDVWGRLWLLERPVLRGGFGLLIKFGIDVIAEGEGVVLEFEDVAGREADVFEGATFGDVNDDAKFGVG